MKSIIHGFNEERALVILGNIRRRIQPQGRPLLVEFAAPPGNTPSLGKLADLQMLVMAGASAPRVSSGIFLPQRDLRLVEATR
jgi:hypothetical protein